MTSKPTILIVDDDTSICQILRKILEGAGYSVLEAYHGKEGLNLFQSHSIDVVLQDLSMPDMNGVEAATKMISSNPAVPIILISAYGSVSKAVEATKLGVYDFMEKPLDRDRILVTVRNALQQHKLRTQLEFYRQEVMERFQMVGKSPAIREVFRLIEKVSPFHSPVLIQGENGVGKELVANAIHYGSPRAGKQMIKINCAAIPDNLIESELFGHSRGAFTGAHTAKKGRLELADRSSLFLDEIGDLSPMAQAKMLRFMESGEIQRVGAEEVKQVDVRLICATNKDIHQLVENGDFREDLYYRINSFPINVPPLRARPDDIPLLVDYFLEQVAQENGLIKPAVSPAAMNWLCQYHWPGNIRQLRSVIERLVIMMDGPVIDIDILRVSVAESQLQGIKVDSMHAYKTLQEARSDFERNYILEVLEKQDWCIAAAAKILDVDRANLYRKIRQLGININKIENQDGG